MTRIKTTLLLRFRQKGGGGGSDYTKYISLKKVISFGMFFILFLIVWDAIFTAPEKRWLQPDFSDSLMKWVQVHPMGGWVVLVLTLAIAVIFMIPIGTPITLGCGYIYKGLYGWKLGVFIATIVSMGGSALGAVTCFLLGRYLMRDQVRLWIKKYPIFDAIDIGKQHKMRSSPYSNSARRCLITLGVADLSCFICFSLPRILSFLLLWPIKKSLYEYTHSKIIIIIAAAEHGLRIMAMLYLTPILPLGPVSYMCGTTSMALSSFILAKVASLPLMLLYVFIGASAGALIGHKKNDKDATTTAGTAVSSSDEFKSIEENTTLIVSGILLSFVMIAGITHNIRKELNKILERQEKHKPGEKESSSSSSTSNNTATSQLSSRDLRVKESAGGGDDDGGGDEEGMEMGSQLVRQRRAG